MFGMPELAKLTSQFQHILANETSQCWQENGRVGRLHGHPRGLEEIEWHLMIESPHDGHGPLSLVADV
jgi:hypothetical protein